MFGSGIGSLAQYEAFSQVGEGTYGFVYRATDKSTNGTVALKKLIIHKENSGFPMCSVREIKFLRFLRHKNIVLLRDIVTSKGCEHLEADMKTSSLKNAQLLASKQIGGSSADRLSRQHSQESSSIDIVKSMEQESLSRQLKRCGSLFLVFEYIEHDLGGLIDAKYKFPLISIKSISKQLFEVLEYLAEKKVIHRDIKSSNILISNYHHVKLADFGLARSTIGLDGREGMHDMTNNVITMWYKPPELLLGSLRYSYSIDIWSVGCVLAELELGRPLFPGKSELEQLDMIFRNIGTPLENNWPSIVNLPLYETTFKVGVTKYSTTFRSSYEGKLSDTVIDFLERVIVADPSKRITAKIAQTNKFYVVDPVPPDNPAHLPPLAIAQGASFHEYETKKIRRAKEDEQRKEKAQITIMESIPLYVPPPEPNPPRDIVKLVPPPPPPPLSSNIAPPIPKIPIESPISRVPEPNLKRNPSEYVLAQVQIPNNVVKSSTDQYPKPVSYVKQLSNNSTQQNVFTKSMSGEYNMGSQPIPSEHVSKSSVIVNHKEPQNSAVSSSSASSQRGQSRRPSSDLSQWFTQDVESLTSREMVTPQPQLTYKKEEYVSKYQQHPDKNSLSSSSSSSRHRDSDYINDYQRTRPYDRGFESDRRRDSRDRYDDRPRKRHYRD